MPSSFCRARTSSRYASQPMSNWPLYRSVHSGQMWCGACIAPNARTRSHGLSGATDAWSSKPDRPSDEILGQVVAVLRQARLVDRLPIEEQLRVPLIRVAAEEAVEAVEAEHRPGRPAVVRARRCPSPPTACCATCRCRSSCSRAAWSIAAMPALSLRLAAVVARETRRQLGDVRHPHRVMVATGEQARPRRRAQRGRVELVYRSPFAASRRMFGVRMTRRTARSTRSRCRRARCTARSAHPPAPSAASGTPPPRSSNVRPIRPGNRSPSQIRLHRRRRRGGRLCLPLPLGLAAPFPFFFVRFGFHGGNLRLASLSHRPYRKESAGEQPA